MIKKIIRANVGCTEILVATPPECCRDGKNRPFRVIAVASRAEHAIKNNRIRLLNYNYNNNIINNNNNNNNKNRRKVTRKGTKRAP